MLNGIDLSQWNSDAQVAKWYPQMDFICHKLTEGKTFTDPKAIARAQMFKGEKPTFWYHLVRPDNGNTPSEEAANYVSKLAQIEKYGSFGLALDLECNYVPYGAPEKTLQWLKELVSNIRKVYPKPVVMYMGDLYPDRWYTELAAVGAEFWIAYWSSHAPKHNWLMWQNTSKYEGENLDHDYCSVTLSELWERINVIDNPAQLIADSGMTPEEVAKIVLDIIEGKYGCGEERRRLLGDKYSVCQRVVNMIFKEVGR